MKRGKKMETIYRRVWKCNNSIKMIPGIKSRNYEMSFTNNTITLRPQITGNSIVVSINQNGAFAIPAFVIKSLKIKSFVKVVKRDDDTIDIYPMDNGNCEICNNVNSLSEYREHIICKECLNKMVNLEKEEKGDV